MLSNNGIFKIIFGTQLFRNLSHKNHIDHTVVFGTMQAQEDCSFDCATTPCENHSGL